MDGAGGAGGAGGAPVAHIIDPGTSYTVPAGQELTIGAFEAPEGAIVDYALLDASQGAPDTLNTAVVTDASLRAGTPVGYALQQGVSTTHGETPGLPAGAYDFIAQCTNVVDPCVIAVSVTATY